MQIIAHRGYWKSHKEKNSMKAFERSLNKGYGIETDVRDFNGEIVISHDYVASKSGLILLQDFIKLISNYSSKKPITIALNVKSDGLANLINCELKEFRNKNFDLFVFDMSVPDMKEYFSANFIVYSRLSEVELNPSWYDQCSGIWLDSFQTNWFDSKLIEKYLNDSKKVCVVSSELHGREKSDLWDIIYSLRKEENIMLCTDLPAEAELFFNSQ